MCLHKWFNSNLKKNIYFPKSYFGWSITKNKNIKKKKKNCTNIEHNTIFKVISIKSERRDILNEPKSSKLVTLK